MAATFGKRPVQAYAPRAVVAAPVSVVAPLLVAPAVPSAAGGALKIPLVTPLLIVLLAIVFAFEVRASPILYGGMSPPVAALINYGAADRALVFAGGWWRLLTAPMLHANLSHIIGNCVVFAIIGAMLEPLIGARWFAALYAAGALGGSLFSIALDPADIPAVGASGAIMGVLAGAFLCGSMHRAGPRGRKMQSRALFLMLPALIPMAADSHTDYAGHLGGVVAGLAMGVLMQMAWPRGAERPELGEAAAGFAGSVLAVALASLVLFARFGGVTEAAATPPGLIPASQMPRDSKVDDAQAADLVARYPHDPRAHLFRGLAFVIGGHDLSDAEEQFRRARDPADVAAAGLDDSFTKEATVLLALTIAYEGRPDEARMLGAPLCGFASENLSDYYDAMVKAHICAAT